MSVPNLKRVALFVQKLLGGSQNFEIRSRDLGHAHLGVVLWSGRSRCPSSMSVPNLKYITLFLQKLLGEVSEVTTEGGIEMRLLLLLLCTSKIERISPIFTPPVYLTPPLMGFPLEFCIGAGVTEN